MTYSVIHSDSCQGGIPHSRRKRWIYRKWALNPGVSRTLRWRDVMFLKVSVLTQTSALWNLNSMANGDPVPLQPLCFYSAFLSFSVHACMETNDEKGQPYSWSYGQCVCVCVRACACMCRRHALIMMKHQPSFDSPCVQKHFWIPCPFVFCIKTGGSDSAVLAVCKEINFTRKNR